MHHYPYQNAKNNFALLRYITKNHPENYEINIVPGTQRLTGQNMLNVIASLEQIAGKELNINFKHIPENINSKDVFLGLHKGELFFCDAKDSLITKTNPKSVIRII